MNHNLTKIEVDGSKWFKCDDCNCVFHQRYWWVNDMKSKEEPECSVDNLDWERRAEKELMPWN